MSLALRCSFRLVLALTRSHFRGRATPVLARGVRPFSCFNVLVGLPLANRSQVASLGPWWLVAAQGDSYQRARALILNLWDRYALLRCGVLGKVGQRPRPPSAVEWVKLAEAFMPCQAAPEN